MEIKPIDKKEEWGNFVSQQIPNPILQSWSWREILELDGLSPQAFFAVNNGEILAAALLAKFRLPLGKCYLYAPRGPVFKTGTTATAKEAAVASLKHYWQNKYPRAIFLRIDPALPAGAVNLHKLGFRKANKEVQPRQTLILDLQKDEQTMLAEMKPKTRYNIRLAEKKGVEITQAHNNEDVETFYRLLKSTGERTNFSPHPLKHYLDLWQALAPDGLRVYLAWHSGRPVAGIMVSNYGQTATYLHGASDNNFRALMAPYLLHWRAITEAKRNGLAFYDFWGVSPSRSGENHAWSGITRFKTGFGGRYEEYLGAYDYVFSSAWYNLFNWARWLRAKFRF